MASDATAGGRRARRLGRRLFAPRRWLAAALLAGGVGGCAAAGGDDAAALYAAYYESLERQRAGDHEAAERQARRALGLAETVFGPEHPGYAVALHQLGAVLHARRRYAEAEPAYLRALAVREATLPADHPERADSLEALAGLYKEQRRHAEAETFFLRAIAARERAAGPDAPAVANLLNSLAAAYYEQRRFEAAEPLYRRALAIREAAPEPDEEAVAVVLNNLASLQAARQRYGEAAALFRRALAIWERRWGPESNAVATGLNNLASLLHARGDYAEAEPLYRRAVQAWEAALGPGHPGVATGLHNLAGLYVDAGRLDEAEPLYRRSLAIWEAALGPEDAAVAVGLSDLAGLLHRQRRSAEALPAIRRATALYAARAGAERGVGGRFEQRSVRHAYLRHLAILDAVPGDALEKAAEALRLVQLARSSEAAAALAQMAARFASGTGALADRVRERQDLVRSLEDGEAALARAIGRPPAARDAAAEDALRRATDGLRARLRALDALLARDFPEYAELAAPPPLALAAAQDLLRPDEAMLAYAVAGDRTFLVVVRRDAAAFRALAPGERELSAAVAALRRGLDPQELREEADLLRFDAERAHALYAGLIAPAEPLLTGARHLFVVPDGALQSLPLGVLLTRPTGPLDTLEKLRAAPWLARAYATTTLPSAASLRALRAFAREAAAPAPFIGIGDPLLDGHPGDEAPLPDPDAVRGAGFRGSLPPASRKALLPAVVFRNGGVDIAELRAAPALPETAGELLSLARALGAGREALVLRSQATEPAVRQVLQRQRYRVLAFATHGLLAGELDGLAEPALVLTPPPGDAAPPEADGLLTASEVARDLRLDADWVILSACNTGAADGTPGAEGLSGLARAFFYAGARSLFVSHWAVPSEAAVALTTTMLGTLAAEPGIGRAEAHRRAMLALMQDAGRPLFAHPMFWAPFVVVGEGGPARAGPRQ